MAKKRFQKVKCDKCKNKINVDEERKLDNFYQISDVSYIDCPYCGQEIKV